MSVKYLPNILSSVRLCMVPLFVFLFLEGNIIPAVIVFILAGATDVLDGYIARHFNCTSTLGKVLDPLADKFLQLSAFLCLWYRDYIPFWLPLIYFAKELATALGALFIFRKTKFVVKSNFFGKLATVLVFGAVFVISLFSEQIGAFGVDLICILVVLYFVFSCGVYCGEDLIKMIRSVSGGKKEPCANQTEKQK